MPLSKASLVIPKVDPRYNIGYAATAFDDFPLQAKGERALKSMLEHDPHYFPLGKVADVSIRDRPEDIVLTVSIDDTRSIRRFCHQATQRHMVEIEFVNDSRPFVHHAIDDQSPLIEVDVDIVNFDDISRHREFAARATDPIHHADKAGLLARRSATPEPLIQFLVANPELTAVLLGTLRRGERFLRYTLDETMRKLGDDISDAISRRIRRIVKVYNEERSTDDRDPTSHLVIGTNPEINLLTRTTRLEQDTDVGLGSLVSQMELHKDLLASAESVTFARSDGKTPWRLLYMETSSGNVITTADCYEETTRSLNLVRGAIPAVLCLRNKGTGLERRYETSVRLKKTDESGNFEAMINPIPEDWDEWDMVSMALDL